MINKETTIKTNNRELRKCIYVAHSKKCFYTGVLLNENEFDIDHILPVSLGGKDNISNYVLSSIKANRRKSNKYDIEITNKLILLNELLFVQKVIDLYNENKYKIDIDYITKKINKIPFMEKSGYYNVLTKLIQERKESKFSQEFMADWLGVSRKKLNEFEQGKIDYYLLCHYADKLSIDIQLTMNY
jgi:DNA-binding XRE family transcriptional regulator